MFSLNSSSNTDTKKNYSLKRKGLLGHKRNYHKSTQLDSKVRRFNVISEISRDLPAPFRRIESYFLTQQNIPKSFAVFCVKKIQI